jgi:hypothetical protein
MSPEVLRVKGWICFFYSNERNEPPHIHVRRGDAYFKFALLESAFDVQEIESYNVSPTDRRAVRRILFANLDDLIEEYRRHQGGR